MCSWNAHKTTQNASPVNVVWVIWAVLLCVYYSESFLLLPSCSKLLSIKPQSLYGGFLPAAVPASGLAIGPAGRSVGVCKVKPWEMYFYTYGSEHILFTTPSITNDDDTQGQWFNVPKSRTLQINNFQKTTPREATPRESILPPSLKRNLSHLLPLGVVQQGSVTFYETRWGKYFFKPLKITLLGASRYTHVPPQEKGEEGMRRGGYIQSCSLPASKTEKKMRRGKQDFPLQSWRKMKQK